MRGWLVLLLLLALALLLWLGLLYERERRIAVVRSPRAVMGTSCTLIAIVPPDRVEDAARRLEEVEKLLRSIEARMSSWIEASEISRLNAAPAGVEMPLSRETLEVLEAAREAHRATDGAFDVTCRPLIELWKEAAKRDALPSAEERIAARASSRWEQLELTATHATKRLGTTQVDLGGIAKGYAIDAAVDALIEHGIESGLVDIGGDQRMFGRDVDAKAWTARIRNPLGGPDEWIAELVVSERAVCTSGDYARSVTIEGRSYSHIIDPRVGRPAQKVLSVTVIAPRTLQADIHATALSVLGPSALSNLPPGVEALLLERVGEGAETTWREHRSPGLAAYLPTRDG